MRSHQPWSVTRGSGSFQLIALLAAGAVAAGGAAAALAAPVAATFSPAPPATTAPAQVPSAASGGAAPAAGNPATAADAVPSAGAAPSSPAGGGASSSAVSSGTATPVIHRVLVGTATDLGVEADQQPAHLGSWLTLEVSGLDALVDRARAQKKELVLYINGMPLTGVPPVYLMSHGQIADVRFALRRTDESKQTWEALLGKPRAERRDVEVSVGVAGCADGCSDITDAVPLPLVVMRPVWLAGFLLGMGAGLWVMWQLARRTPMLRDGNMGSPWSLGRIQMAWWTLIVVASFVFIWMVTGGYGSLTNSVLALIGISSATGLAGAVIDDNKQAQVKQRQALQAAAQKAAAAVPGAVPPATGAAGGAAAPAGAATAAPSLATMAAAPLAGELAAQLERLPVAKLSQSLLLDILSDENGVSFHRLQVVIWTLVMTLIFVVSVYTHLDMPDFDTQLLALMGISNGTYIGFKLPEKQVAAPS